MKTKLYLRILTVVAVALSHALLNGGVFTTAAHSPENTLPITFRSNTQSGGGGAASSSISTPPAPCNGAAFNLAWLNGVPSKVEAINFPNSACAVTFLCDGAMASPAFPPGSGPVIFACPAGTVNLQVAGVPGNGNFALFVFGIA